MRSMPYGLRSRHLAGWLVVAWSCLSLPHVSVGNEPLHVRIDRLIDARLTDSPRAEPADDAEFLRRVFLDLGGRIPTFAETVRFLEDTRSDKRQLLIDDLLASTDHPRRMRELFHAMLLERRGENAEWDAFLQHVFEQRLPWHEIVRALLKPDADNEATRGSAFFLTQRLTKEGAMAPVDVPGLTRDVGRLLAGRDLQCAECHDHISIEHFRQRDFQGLHMIFENIQARSDVKFPAVSEKLLSQKKEFQSVFGGDAQQTGPVVPGGTEITIPVFAEGEEYLEPPDRKKRTAGIPKFSPLQSLAENLASPQNPVFARNIANRLWFVMMGRGLVEPLDLIHPGNPATHPELLDLLSAELAEHDFDLQWMLRELALTNTYQRASIAPAELTDSNQIDGTRYAVSNEKRMSAEQLFWSVMVASGELNRESRTNLPEAEVAPGTDPTSESNAPVADAGNAVGFVDDLKCLDVLNSSDRLKALRKEMIATYSNPPKEPEIDFAPTVKGALYLMHDQQMQSLLADDADRLVRQVGESESSAAAARRLFLSVLTREPRDDEIQLVERIWSRDGEARIRGLSNLLWALFSSTEFVVNH